MLLPDITMHFFFYFSLALQSLVLMNHAFSKIWHDKERFRNFKFQIPAELITLDGDSLTGVDVPTVQEQIEERNKKIFIKPANIEFDPRHKMKGKGGSAKRHHIRKAVIEQARKTNLKADIGKWLFDVRYIKKNIKKYW